MPESEDPRIRTRGELAIILDLCRRDPSAAVTVLRHDLAQRERIATLEADNRRLREALNTPEIEDFARAVVSEAQHQRHRWGAEHDAGKEPPDWFWLVGYLAGKCFAAHLKGDTE